MENSFYHSQIFGSEGGLVFNQADAEDIGDYDVESKLRCPACECAIPVSETCGYCNFDLIQWALQQSNVGYVNPIEDALKELKENYT